MEVDVFFWGGAWRPEPTGVQLDGILWNMGKKLSDIYHHVPTFFFLVWDLPCFFLLKSQQPTDTNHSSTWGRGFWKSEVHASVLTLAAELHGTGMAWRSAEQGRFRGPLSVEVQKDGI